MSAKWVVVVIGPDGTPSTVGPFASEYTSTIWANDHETMETGWACYPCPLENPAEAQYDV
jgi:hypothetical protein